MEKRYRELRAGWRLWYPCLESNQTILAYRNATKRLCPYTTRICSPTDTGHCCYRTKARLGHVRLLDHRDRLG